MTISRERWKGERSQFLDLWSLRAGESFKAVYVGISHMGFFTMLFTEWMLGQRATRISLFPLLPSVSPSKPWVTQTTIWVRLTHLSSWNIAVSWIQLHVVSSLIVPRVWTWNHPKKMSWFCNNASVNLLDRDWEGFCHNVTNVSGAMNFTFSCLHFNDKLQNISKLP